MIREEEIESDNPFLRKLIYDDKGYIFYEVLYDRIEISAFFVKEEFRNSHIGSKLLEYLIDYAEKQGMINITLEVRCDNDPAIHIYKKYGFKEVAKREKYYDGIDGILMEKKLI